MSARETQSGSCNCTGLCAASPSTRARSPCEVTRIDMWPGVWPGVGTAVSVRVSACSPFMNSTRPRSASGQTHVGAFGKRVGCTSGWWHASQSLVLTQYRAFGNVGTQRPPASVRFQPT